MPDPSPPVSVLSLVHDSVIDSIRLEDRSLTLVTRAVEGELVTLEITGVVDLVIDNLRLGNIVTYLKPVSSDDLDESLKRSLLQLLPGEDVALAWSGSKLAGKRALSIDTAYGMDFACVVAEEGQARLIFGERTESLLLPSREPAAE